MRRRDARANKLIYVGDHAKASPRPLRKPPKKARRPYTPPFVAELNPPTDRRAIFLARSIQESQYQGE